MFFDSEAPVSYDYFVNLKNLPAQILRGAHRVALCASFIEVSVRVCERMHLYRASKKNDPYS